MRKIIILIIGIIFYANPIQSQIYYKEIIYIFDYKIEKDDMQIETGLLYLGCLGKPWPFKEQKQAAVIWSTNKAHLSQKMPSTGIYEEDDRIWLHPPRQNQFSILEYSPFPDIRFPVSKNMNWKRDFIPGKNWINKKYDVKENDILKFNYRNIGVVVYNYKNFNLKCWEINAESINLKNRTSFSGLFNSEYGFIKMIFTNIDKSIITLEIRQIQSWDLFQSIDIKNAF